jgi:hypothetical protein
MFSSLCTNQARVVVVRHVAISSFQAGGTMRRGWRPRVSSARSWRLSRSKHCWKTKQLGQEAVTHPSSLSPEILLHLPVLSSLLGSCLPPLTSPQQRTSADPVALRTSPPPPLGANPSFSSSRASGTMDPASLHLNGMVVVWIRPVSALTNW